MGPEKKFENQVKKFLDGLEHTWYFKVHGNGVQSSGIPDIIACIRGIFVALEIKSDEGRLSEIQKVKLKEIHDSWGMTFVLSPSNFENYKFVLEKIGNSHPPNRHEFIFSEALRDQLKELGVLDV